MATKNEVAKSEQKKVGIASYLCNEAVKKNIENVVGGNSQTFIASVVSAVQTNPTLSKCSNQSILSGALLGESLKLSPSPQLGNYYLVPYGNEAQFQIGYKGLIQLAIRSGQYRKIVASEIKDGEVKGYNPITEEFELDPITDVMKRAELPTVGYYAMFELNNGFRKEIYWTKEQMLAHANKFSKGFQAKKGYTFWEKDFDAMSRKTMLRQLLSKWGIMSVDMQKAYDYDQSVIREDGSYRYVDNEADKVEVNNPFDEGEVVDAEVKEVKEDEEG